VIDENREPTADMRAAARQLREYYVALIREGFTEMQAIRIIGMVIAGQSGDKGE
jgi:hypothetical protein